ncbi:copper chaperone PCu(A)C [Paenalcaligenes niemegkensis]|uniref:copper chaperone PCu(A)C n=1 Tax=Paenalcaligenes niemegkensis TaxID=2895469 RepID=UPI001EE98ACC|nr:copper chaperone PCu(A)C [Paenalcaligenes niemegkensis]MCQ9615318.1 copper chaperone PCu(A)C [Paenalcaligenes niemegkensis]
MKKTSFNIVLTAALAFSSVAMAHGDHGHQHEHHGHAKGDYADEFASAKPSSTIEVSDCWIRNIPTPAPSAGYFVVKNNGKEAVKLLAAASSQYDDLMLHQTIDEDGMAKMKMADEILIEAGDSLEFKPGGFHAMLEKPTSAVQTGDELSLEFLFSNHEKVVAHCEAMAPGTRAHQH